MKLMKKKMTSTQLNQYIISEVKKLVKTSVLKEVGRLNERYSSNYPDGAEHDTDAPYNQPDDEIDFEEEVSIVVRNTFRPVVEKFLLNKRAQYPDLDWGDFEDEDNVSSIFEDSHNRNLLNITDEEVIDIAGDIRDEIAKEERTADKEKKAAYTKHFNNMFDNPLGQLDDLSDSLGMKNESKTTTSELKQYVIAEANKLVKAEMLKEKKTKILGQLKKLNEGSIDINGKSVKTYTQNGDKSYNVTYDDGTKDIIMVSNDSWDKINTLHKNATNSISESNSVIAETKKLVKTKDLKEDNSSLRAKLHTLVGNEMKSGKRANMHGSHHVEEHKKAEKELEMFLEENPSMLEFVEEVEEHFAKRLGENKTKDLKTVIKEEVQKFQRRTILENKKKKLAEELRVLNENEASMQPNQNKIEELIALMKKKGVDYEVEWDGNEENGGIKLDVRFYMYTNKAIDVRQSTMHPESFSFTIISEEPRYGEVDYWAIKGNYYDNWDDNMINIPEYEVQRIFGELESLSTKFGLEQDIIEKWNDNANYGNNVNVANHNYDLSDPHGMNEINTSEDDNQPKKDATLKIKYGGKLFTGYVSNDGKKVYFADGDKYNNPPYKEDRFVVRIGNLSKDGYGGMSQAIGQMSELFNTEEEARIVARKLAMYGDVDTSF